MKFLSLLNGEYRNFIIILLRSEKYSATKLTRNVLNYFLDVDIPF